MTAIRRKYEFICLVIVCVLDLAWIINELIAVNGVSDSRNAIVVGQIEGSKIKGYIYFTSLCLVLYALTRVGTLYSAKDTFGSYVELTLFNVALSGLGTVLYELPVNVLVYLVSECRNNYLIRAQIASRVIQILAVIARATVLTIMNVKAFIRQETEKSSWPHFILTWLATLLYFGGAAAVLGLSITTLKDHKLINSYDPHTSDVSVMFVPPGLMGSGPVSDFPMGKTLSTQGVTTDHFIALTSLNDLIKSDDARTRLVGSGKHQQKIKGRYSKALIDCKLVPMSLRPTSCNDTVQLVFRYDVRDTSFSPYSGRVYFNCGLWSRGQCHEGCPPAAEGWEVRLVNRVRRNTTAGTDDSLVTTPWQDVASCGETPVKMDHDMSACRASSFGVSGLLLASSFTALGLLCEKLL